MEVATPTTAASLSAINETLMRISVTLGRMAARQDQMLVDSKKMTATLAPIVATTPMSVPGRGLEQQKTKTSSSSLFSVVPVMGAGARHTDAVVASAMPSRCSTKSPSHYIDSGHAELVFPGSGTTHLPATTSSGAAYCTLQGVGGAGMSTPARCSTHVLNWRPLVPGTRACKGDANMTCGPLGQVEDHPADRCPLRPQTSFPRFNGDNPRFWRAKCLEFFKTFSIPECMWATAARLHMEGIAADWYHTHRLRRPVGDWSEFMNAMEAHFVVGDSETHDTFEQQMRLYEASLQGVTQMPETTAAGHEEVLTKVGGVSLILEPFAQHAEVVFSKLHSMEPEGEVFHTVGGLSLFLEEGLCSTTQVCDAVLFEDVSGPDEVLTHVGGLSLFLELDMDSTNKVFEDDVLTTVGGVSLFLDLDMDYDDEIFTYVGDRFIFLELGMSGPIEVLVAPSFQHVVCAAKIAGHILSHADGSSFYLDVSVCSGTDYSPCKCSDYSPWNFSMEYKMLPWCRNGFSPGFYRWPSLSILKLIDNCWVVVQLFSSSELATREISHKWRPGNWLWSLQFVTTDPFLGLEEFKESDPHNSTYIQLVLQEILLFCWKAKFCIFWCGMSALLCRSLHAPGQHTRLSSCPMWYMWRLECTQQQKMYGQILQLMPGCSAPSKVEFIYLHALEKQMKSTPKVGLAKILKNSIDTLASSESLMRPSEYLLMPWDPGDVQNKASPASPIQSTSIRVVSLKRQWDPGVCTINKAFGLSV